MVRERHGEKVSSLERLNKLFVRDYMQSSAVVNERRNSAAKPRFRGWKHEEP